MSGHGVGGDQSVTNPSGNSSPGGWSRSGAFDAYLPDAVALCRLGSSPPSPVSTLPWLGSAAAILAWWLCLGSLWSHPAFSTSAEIVFDPDGRFHGRAEFDTLAFALNDSSSRIGNEPMDQLLAGPREELVAQLANAKTRFSHGFQVKTDAGPGLVDSLAFSEADAVLKWRDTMRPVLPVVVPVEFAGHLPPGARSIAVRFPSVLDQVVLEVQRPGEEPFLQPVDPGTESSPLPIKLADLPAASAGAKRGENLADKPARRAAAQTGTGSWLQGPRFMLAISGLILLSFLAAFGWSKLSAKA